MSARGFFAIGIYHPKNELNVGGLWRSAQCFGASFIFTIGRRYRRQPSDVSKAPLHLPLFHYTDMDDLFDHLPKGCRLIGVELDKRSRPLTRFAHPEQAVYLLGAEDHGLPQDVMDRCHLLVEIPFANRCLNVASAGTVVLYDRVRQLQTETIK